MPGILGRSPAASSAGMSYPVEARLALGVAVGDDAVGVLVAQLEEVGDLAEHAGDVLVLHAPSEPSRSGPWITRRLVECDP